ncbi:hypothetical protein TanjilG_05421 [Lupinus angustifolius]|uniref:Uncharacterized protein n=1 Tax=Lupinus angustifolius TaxID=3871 RepID=A0A1J7HPR5_LUPAN|nr:hypothetical protein TanjilG_05421 [Lupinus angustifolius]
MVTNGVGTSSAVIQNQSSSYPEFEKRPAVPPTIVSDTTTPTSMVSGQKSGRTFTSSHGLERDNVLLRSKEKIISVVTEGEGGNNTQVQQCCSVSATRRMSMPRESRATWNSSHQPIRTLEGDASSFDLKQKNPTPEHMPRSERLSSGSTMSLWLLASLISCD